MFFVINPRIFYEVLDEGSSIARMSFWRVSSLESKISNIDRSIRGRETIRDEKWVVDYIKDRVILEASVMMHDNGIMRINYSREECPLTYDLMVKNRIALFSEGE